MTTILAGAAIATVDAQGREHAEGHVAYDGSRLTAVGAGSAPGELMRDARVIDVQGCLVTPGLVNCHHHLYQWLTRGRAVDSTLFQWLVELYPVWAGIDVEGVHVAAKAGLAQLALSGCSLSMDHHYVFPHDAGDLLAAEIGAARELGVRFHPTRGSMDLGQAQGGLPPDSVVEDRDTILAATAEAIDRHHDRSPDAMLRIAVAPCSPFSVSRELMVEAADLARDRGVRLHTHLAETLDEEAFCQERFGCRPVEYLEGLGWLGPDVWLAHCVHLSEPEITRLAETQTGVAHCPSSNARLGAGVAPVTALLGAGARVGLGVDGVASNEAGELGPELRQAIFAARARYGPQALSVRQALWLGTYGGALCLGRHDELGSLEDGKLADIAVWDLTSLDHAGIADPVAALVLGPRPRLRLLVVQGETIVEDGRLLRVDEDALAVELARQCALLDDRSRQTGIAA